MSTSPVPKKIDGEYSVQILQKMLENENLREIELVAELDEKRFWVHRLVMSSASEYFRALFESKFEDGQKLEFVIPDVDGAMLEMIIEFCYSGNIGINEKNVKRIIVAATPLLLVGIQIKCATFWSDSLSLANCIEIFAEADKYNLVDLRTKSFEFICVNFEMLSASEWLKISKSFVNEFLKSDGIRAREDFVFLRMMEWINSRESTRSQYASEMMGLIRLDRITQPFLRDVVESFAKKFDCIDFVYRELSRRAENDDKSTNLLRFDVENPKSIFALSCESGIMNVAKYYPITNRWEFFRNITITGLMTTRTSFGVMFANDIIFLIGGNEQINYSKKIDTYLLDKMELLTRSNLRENRNYVMPIMFKNEIFMFGGFNGAAMHTCECSSLETMEVKTIASMQFGRYNYAGTVLNGKIYVAGGQTANNTQLNSVECYDPESNQWTKIANMHYARANFALVAFHGMLYAMGVHKVVERYDPMRDVWYEVGSFDGSETVMRAMESQNEVYVLLQDGQFGKLSMDAASCVFKPLRNPPLSNEVIRHLFVN